MILLFYCNTEERRECDYDTLTLPVCEGSEKCWIMSWHGTGFPVPQQMFRRLETRRGNNKKSQFFASHRIHQTGIGYVKKHFA